MISLNISNFKQEAKKFISLGLPILGTQLVMYGLTTTDYIMAGYYSSDDLAGLGLAASIFNPIYFLTAGVMFGINPIIAQLYGKKDFVQIRLKTRRFLWAALLIGFVWKRGISIPPIQFIHIKPLGFQFIISMAEIFKSTRYCIS